jgi:hypothetical protein
MPNKENVIPHQWKKGECGNPKGRPKGSKNLKTILRKWLDTHDEMKNPITGEQEVVTVEEKIVVAQIGAAINGDTRAFNAVMDRVYGKSRQAVELSTDPDNPLTINNNVNAEVEVDYTKLPDEALLAIYNASKKSADETIATKNTTKAASSSDQKKRK